MPALDNIIDFLTRDTLVNQAVPATSGDVFQENTITHHDHMFFFYQRTLDDGRILRVNYFRDDPSGKSPRKQQLRISISDYWSNPEYVLEADLRPSALDAYTKKGSFRYNLRKLTSKKLDQSKKSTVPLTLTSTRVVSNLYHTILDATANVLLGESNTIQIK